jgi:predicted RNase H-like HicB family nuclease
MSDFLTFLKYLLAVGTIEEAIQNAKEAFACHIEALQKQGKKIPEPKGKLMYA